MAKKEKKEKVRYYDDGRTLADMSNVSGGSRLHDHNPYRPKGFYKELWKTYWNAVKMMFLPMLATIGAICVIFGILALVFGVLA